MNRYFAGTVVLCLLLGLNWGALRAQEVENGENGENETDSVGVVMRSGEEGFYNNHFNLSFASPNVAELAKYSAIPVNFNTGTPNIEIPLYTIQCGNITLPISLNYHASGITVDQIATWVGLGWSLNAGGVITKTVLDKADDTNGIVVMKSSEWAEYAELCPFNYLSISSLDSHCDSRTMPNLYSYNFSGHVGKFFDYKYKAHDLNGSLNVKFDLSRSRPSATDLKGFRYMFNDMETATTCSFISTYNYPSLYTSVEESTGDYPQSSSYYLSKIVSPSGKDSITFNYNSVMEHFKPMPTGLLSRKINGDWGDYWSDLGERTHAYTSYETHCHTKKNSEIIASNGLRIVFTANTIRQDTVNFTTTVSYPKALSKIEVFDTNNNLLKKWTFEYEYFVSPNRLSHNEPANKRLKLKALKEYGNNESTPRVYRFTYYGEIYGEPELPFIGSFVGRDFLGYCNQDAVFSNNSIKQSFSNATFSDKLAGHYPADSLGYFAYGRDLNTNNAYVYAYSLKEITYPTGGKRKFVYEAHTHGPYLYGGQRTKKIINYHADNDSTVQTYNYLLGISVNPLDIFREREIDKCTEHMLGPYINPLHFPTQYYDISSTPRNSLAYHTSGGGVRYASVEEYVGTSKTIYKYSSTNDYPAAYSGHRTILALLHEYEYPEVRLAYNRPWNEKHPSFNFNYISPDYCHGHLIEKTTFTDLVNDGLIISEFYDYDFEVRDTIPFMEVFYGMKPWSRPGRTYYDIMVSDYITGKAKLREKATAVYTCLDEYYEDAQGYFAPKCIRESYTYNTKDLLTQRTITDSEGNEESREIRYVQDVSSNSFTPAIMTILNMYNYPIEEVRRVNGQVVSADILTYDIYDLNYISPKKTYSLKTSSPLTNYSYYDGISVNPAFGEPIGEIKALNSHGRIAHIRDKEYIETVYLWGYKNMYPVAVVKNAGYEEVVRRLGTYSIETIASSPTLTTEHQNLLARLKFLSGAHVTLYTYKPFVGVQSVTTPNGETTHYDYNDFGELIEIYKMEGTTRKTIESYEYNYRNN